METNEPTFRPYRPSNGTEGARFHAEYCDRCACDAAYRAFEELEQTDPHRARMTLRPEPCEILTRTLFLGLEDDGYPRDTWVYFNGKPTCLAFRDTDDGEGAPPVDPNQLDLFSLPIVEVVA